jgi:hypothetical protein
MNMTRSSILLIAVLLGAGLFLMGCRPEPSPPGAQNPTQEDRLFARFMEKNLGTDWYGIYLQKHKVGYLKSTADRESGPGGTVYKIQLSGTVRIPSPAEIDEIKIQSIAEFGALPPFSLVRYTDRMIHKDDFSEVEILRISKGYQAGITRGKETQFRFMGHLDYTLKDFTAVQRWITRKPDAGADIEYPHLVLETLTLEANTSRIIGIHEAFTAGVKTTFYDVHTTGAHGLEVQEVFGADGRAYRIVLGGLFECRLEPQALAIRIDKTIDLFLKNTVFIDRPLGDSETVTLLDLSLDNTSGTLLGNAPGQSVTQNRADGSIGITLNSKGVPFVKATEEEIKKNLAATIDIPANHPAVIGLAQHAVDGADTVSEKVSRLVEFVEQYIEDDYTANPLTLMDIIEKKKGDCSEHAKLFTAMARALGISCRTVGGLVYLGDEYQAFGLHAWNEVVMGGVWVPVDPTWGQNAIDATHIRFPVEISKEWQVMAAIPEMKIAVLHIEHQK